MKGTKLWQGTSSPLIEGKSRTARPFWQPWLLSAVSAAVLSAGAAWLWRGRPFVLLFAASSLAGAAAGVGMTRLTGSRRGWLGGALAAVVANAVLFGVLALWFPSTLVFVGGVL